MGREAKIRGKLTKKQSAFVQNLLNGRSATQAALSAYNTASAHVAASIANENLNKPDVQEAIDEAFRAQGVSPSLLMSELGKLATSQPEKISGEVKLKSIIEILKLMGAYQDKREYNISIRSQMNSLTFSEAKMHLKKLQGETEGLLAEV